MKGARIPLPTPLSLFRPRRGASPRRAAPSPRRLRVRRTDAGWSLLVDQIPTPAWTVATKRRATAEARAAARELGCPLIIERADGTVQPG